MKKFLTIFSSIISLFVVSSTYAQPYVQPYTTPCNGQYYDRPCCVGQCSEPCARNYEAPCPKGRVYVGAFGGANWLHFHGVKGIHAKTTTGYTGALSLGYKFNNGFRVEGEASYRRNRLHAHSGSDKAEGSAHSWSYMANVLYDFDNVSCYMPHVVPYLGVGVGCTHLSAHAKEHGVSTHESFKGRATGFAYQGIAGVGYRLTKDTTLGVEYRCFAGRKHAEDHSVGLALRQAF